MSMSPERAEKIYVCRCEEVTLDEIDEWIDRGFDTVTELKRVLRVCMGPCQGRGCQEILMREIAKKTGRPLSEISPVTVRPPVKPIKLGFFVENATQEDKPGIIH